MAALELVFKRESPMDLKVDEELPVISDLQEVKQEGPGSPGIRESFLAMDDDFLLLPEQRLEGEALPMEFDTPVVEVTPPLADIFMPTDGVFSFEDAQRDNQNMKPASLFLKLLEMVKAGEVELEQSGDFGPLRIRQLLGV